MLRPELLHWAHTFLPADHLRGPLPEEEDPQSAQRDPPQRRLVLGLSALGASASGFPLAPRGTLFLASLKLPFLEMGTSGCWLTSGPHGAFRGGQGVQGCQHGKGAYLPMHVRPSEWRAYFWWQPHMGPVSVSSQLCWQPPFP